MVLSCQALDYYYGSRPALAGVEFSLQPGCAGLLGPNGAGKSTLMNCLLGRRKIPAGRVQVLGHDPAREPLEVRRQVGVMPEADAYLPGVNGLEMTVFCARLCGLPRSQAMSRAHEVLGYVGLGEERYRQVEQYSTGMRQRLKLACALVHGPRLLLLDEPTTGLDPTGREQMLELIDEVSRRGGVSVLLSSHILGDIEQVCDQVVMLAEGRVVFSGDRQEFATHGSGRLQVKVKSQPERLAQALQQRGCQVRQPPGRGYLEVKLPTGHAEGLVWRLAKQLGLQIRHLSPLAAGLDEAFRQALHDAGPAGSGEQL